MEPSKPLIKSPQLLAVDKKIKKIQNLVSIQIEEDQSFNDSIQISKQSKNNSNKRQLSHRFIKNEKFISRNVLGSSQEFKKSFEEFKKIVRHDDSFEKTSQFGGLKNRYSL